MKIKKIFASIAAVAMMATMVGTINASAASDIVDFENGDCSFVSMKTDDGGDNSKLSVVDFGGSKQLKVEIQDATLIPKIKFDLSAMVGAENLSKIDKIYLDMTIESQDGVTAPGWNGGAIGTQGPNWSQGDWTVEEYENSTSATVTLERKFLLPSDRLTDNADDAHMLIMKWAGEVGLNLYIDNIKFLDKDGNQIAVNVGAAAAVEAAPEASAPEADSSTPSSGTGNTAAAAIVSVMAVAGAAAIATKKRK